MSASAGRMRSSGQKPRILRARRGGRHNWRAEQIGREEQHGRAGTSACRGNEGLIDVVLHAVGRDDAPGPFGASAEQRDVVELLERVAVRLGALDLLHQGDDRDARFQGFGQRRHQQRCGGTILRRDHRDLARPARVAVGHCAAHVLLPVGELANADGFAGQDDGGRQALAKDDFDPVPHEGTGDALRNALVARRHQLSSANNWAFSSRKRSNTDVIRSISSSPIGTDKQAEAPLGKLTPASWKKRQSSSMTRD